MGLMLALLVAMLTLTAVLMATAAMRNGVLGPDQTSDQQTRHPVLHRPQVASQIVEPTRVRPQHVLR
ncbi:MAG: hypothetical protein M3Y66_04085 [Actinomycetota bacterium]|nr:hypothetical protein [Actinomycetota bacterium]